MCDCFRGSTTIDTCCLLLLFAAACCRYPGIEGAHAIAATIFGDYNPAGRTASTWYESTASLPDYSWHHGDMDESAEGGLTYRFIQNRSKAVYPFGFGLSYTSFAYSNLTIGGENAPAACESLKVSVDVTNRGTVAGDEVVQVYVKLPEATVPTTRVRLVAFERLSMIQPGATERIELTIEPSATAVVYPSSDVYNDTRWVEKGKLELFVGGGQPDYTAGTLAATAARSSTALLSSCQ